MRLSRPKTYTSPLQAELGPGAVWPGLQANFFSLLSLSFPPSFAPLSFTPLSSLSLLSLHPLSHSLFSLIPCRAPGLQVRAACRALVPGRGSSLQSLVPGRHPRFEGEGGSQWGGSRFRGGGGCLPAGRGRGAWAAHAGLGTQRGTPGNLVAPQPEPLSPCLSSLDVPGDTLMLAAPRR